MELRLRVRTTGLANAVGLYPRAVEAAVHAGISRVELGSFCDVRGEPASLACVPDASLAPLAPELDALRPLTSRTRRMLRLGGVALREALGRAGALPTPPPVLLATPASLVLPRTFVDLLARQAGVAVELGLSHVEPGGRATSLALLQRAASLLSEGRATAVVVGGVDSQIDLRTLAAISLEDRLHTAICSDGFAPGEGAGFVVLTAARSPDDTGCVLASLGLDRELGTRDSDVAYLGDGLARAFEQALTSATAPASVVVSSFNGERYWGRELGTAVLRSRPALREDLRLEHPVQCFGDLGAATGVSLLALLIEALGRRRFDGPGIVYAASDDGVRAAVRIEREAA